MYGGTVRSSVIGFAVAFVCNISSIIGGRKEFMA
jgi:hypothetical protein